MLKLILLFIISMYVNVSFSQDTVINYELKQVVVLHSKHYFKEIYSFKKDPSIKEGTYYLFTDSLVDFYQTKGYHKNNLRTKTWESCNSKHGLLYTFKYKKGLLNGKSKQFTKTGLIYLHTYKKDLRQGTAKYYIDYKKISKGKYSNKYIDILWKENEFIYSFSNGDTLRYTQINSEELSAMLKEYDVVLQSNRVWLRKGIWKLYSPEGKVIQRMKYRKDGKLIYKNILVENELEFELW